MLDRAASRLALSIVTAALIIGSAIVLTVEHEPVLPGGFSIGMVGFIASVISGVLLLISIWRGGGRK
jgi:ubiquinone biosynthesis protein